MIDFSAAPPLLAAIPAYPGAVDPGPFFVLLLAMAADAAFGDWLGRILPDPAGWARRRCADYDRRLNKESRGDGARLARGVVLAVALAGLAVTVGLAVEWFAGRVRVGWVLELVLLMGCLRARAAWSAARKASRTLGHGDLAAARDAAAPLTRRYVLTFDQHAVARAAVEFAARSFVRRLAAPAFWWLLAGLPGVLALAVIEGADAAVGRPGVRHERFGLTAARLDDALNYLPARLAALLLALATPFLSGARIGRAFATWRADAGKSASRNMGPPVAVVAGALDLALAGPHRDGGVVIDEAWIGGGRARATAQDVDRALALTMIAALLLALLAVLLLLAAVG